MLAVWFVVLDGFVAEPQQVPARKLLSLEHLEARGAAVAVIDGRAFRACQWDPIESPLVAGSIALVDMLLLLCCMRRGFEGSVHEVHELTGANHLSRHSAEGRFRARAGFVMRCGMGVAGFLQRSEHCAAVSGVWAKAVGMPPMYSGRVEGVPPILILCILDGDSLVVDLELNRHRVDQSFLRFCQC
eukprot:359830-Chlamydomonas_euryale.AAC.1